MPLVSLRKSNSMSTAAGTGKAERAVASVVHDFMDKSAIESVRVSAAEDHTGEQALYVFIRLKSGHGRPSGADSIRLMKAMRDALQDIDDDRFPYLSFSAPGDEQAEDTRSAA